MKKECRVVMLPTEKASDICNTWTGDEYVLTYYNGQVNKSDKYRPQHLYILSDDEIKEGDWVLDKLWDNKTFKIKKWEGDDKYCIDLQGKIIATTDSSLKIITGIVGSGTGVPLPQPSQSFIQKYIDAYNSGKPIEKVMVEYADLGDGRVVVQHYKDNTIDIETQKDSWTREEVVDLLKEMKHFVESTPNIHPSEFDKWIEENL